MILKDIDLVSPYTTLYFNGHLKHSSIVSSILTIIAWITIFVLSIFFLLEFFEKKNPNIFYFQKHINDTGTFEMGPNGLFHYLTFGTQNFLIDQTKIKIIGLEVNPAIYFATKTSELPYDHWEYGICSNHNEYKKVAEEILYDNLLKDLIDVSFCITRYHSKQLNKTFTLGEEGFIFPVIKHGASSLKAVNYGLFILSTDGDEKYVSDLSYYTIHFLDTYISVDTYNTPLKTFFYNISSTVSQKTFTINHLNFHPLFMGTNDGFVFDSEKQVTSYVYVQNEKIAYDPEITRRGIVGSYYFWMQNRADIYKRSYRKIQDALANIGGVSKFITTVAVLINKVFYNYTVVSDFNKSFEVQEESEKITKKNATISHSLPRPMVTLKSFKTEHCMRKVKVINFKEFFLYYIRIKYSRIIFGIAESRRRIISEERILKMHLTMKLFKKNLSETMCKKKFDASMEFGLLQNYNQVSLNGSLGPDRTNLVLKN